MTQDWLHLSVFQKRLANSEQCSDAGFETDDIYVTINELSAVNGLNYDFQVKVID